MKPALWATCATLFVCGLLMRNEQKEYEAALDRFEEHLTAIQTSTDAWRAMSVEFARYVPGNVITAETDKLELSLMAQFNDLKQEVSD